MPSGFFRLSLVLFFVEYFVFCSRQLKETPSHRKGTDFANSHRVQQNCGIPNPKYPPNSRPVGRVLNGYPANPHSFPWLAEIKRGDRHICGASVIRCPNSEQAKVLISASHCFNGYDNSNIVVSLGKNDLTETEEGQHVTKADVLVHENFNATTFFNDIALLKLENPVNFGETIQPICLPKKGQFFKMGMPVIVAGWGSTIEYSPSSTILRQVDVKIIHSRLCNEWFRVFRGELDYDKMLCAGYKDGLYDSCQIFYLAETSYDPIAPTLQLRAYPFVHDGVGVSSEWKASRHFFYDFEGTRSPRTKFLIFQGDSGGSLIVKSRDFSDEADDFYVLVGAVSYGEGCGVAEQPGIYARVSNYIDWIEKNSKKLCAQ